jgi:hypothetical protein
MDIFECFKIQLEDSRFSAPGHIDILTELLQGGFKKKNDYLLFNNTAHLRAQLVEALCYKPEGRGFDSRSGHWIFQLT